MIRHVLGVVALFGAIVGSVFVAANSGVGHYGYMLFLASSFSATYLLVTSRTREVYLILQNLFFVGVNIFGIYMHWS